MRLLLEVGVDINSPRAKDGATALYSAAAQGHLEVVVLLLDTGADMNRARTDMGATPLHLAS